MLIQVLQSPKALHGTLESVVGAVSRVKARDDGEKISVFGFEIGRKGCGFSVAHARDDLPLIDQVGIASQGRGAPCVTWNANARVGQGFGPHAHFDAWRQGGLAAVNPGDTEFGHPLAPAAIGQNHRFCHDQIQWGAALAGRDNNLFIALG